MTFILTIFLLGHPVPNFKFEVPTYEMCQVMGAWASQTHDKLDRARPLAFTCEART
jgi:hypothetical protein